MLLTEWETIFHNSLQENRPKTYRQLKTSGELLDHVQRHVREVTEYMLNLIQAGVDPAIAQQEARFRLCVPDEREVPDLFNNPYER